MTVDIKRVTVGGTRLPNGNYTHAVINVIPSILEESNFTVGDYYVLKMETQGIFVKKIAHDGSKKKGIKKIMESRKILFNRSELVESRLDVGTRVMLSSYSDGVIFIRKLDGREADKFNSMGGS